MCSLNEFVRKYFAKDLRMDDGSKDACRGCDKKSSVERQDSGRGTQDSVENQGKCRGSGEKYPRVRESLRQGSRKAFAES